MKVTLCQVNPTVADLYGNLELMKNEIMLAFQAQSDVVLFPELVTTAYPPRDYLYQQWIWDEQNRIAVNILTMLRGLGRQMTVIYGGLHEVACSHGGKERFNAAYIVDPHYGIRFVHKRLLPQYDVFDESRYFKSAVDEPYRPIPILIQGKKERSYVEYCDVLICEDIWNNRYQGDTRLMPTAYRHDPVELVATRGGDGPLFVLNGSPYWEGKVQTTRNLVEDICKRLKKPVCWVNQVGAQDDIVTGGYSMVAIPAWHTPNVNKAHIRMAKAFQTDRLTVRLVDAESPHDAIYDHMGDEMGLYGHGYECPMIGEKQIEASEFSTWCDYQACVMFIRDYAQRCGFKKAVLGVSGGIDSAVVAALAAEALGGENVLAISMPSRFSSEGSKTDARLLSQSLGLDYAEVPIDDLHQMVRSKFLSGGRQSFDSPLTDENIQPRLRAIILMTVSNDQKALLLTTGNKSEITVGYCTLYGDTCGGIAPLADMWKTEVFRMARFINKYCGEVIPINTIEKPPSAELRADQKDTDSLPPYTELDPILKQIVEEDRTPNDLVQPDKAFSWFPQIYRMYKNAEFKRTQMPPGAKLKARSFGSGRRMPIAASESHL